MANHTRRFLMAFLLTAFILAGETCAPTAAQSATTIPLFGLFETQFSVPFSAANPYDTTQVEVNARFVSPGGVPVSVPAFWMQPYQQTCTQDCAVEILSPSGSPGWRVRFTPNEIGTWNYTIEARSSSAGVSQVVAQGSITVVPSKQDGFVRVGKNRRYFGYDSGKPYFPIGSNLGWSWSGARGTLGYQAWLKKLHEVGANYGRLYVDVPWFIGLDWRGPVGDYTKAQEDAWRLDAILQTAEEQGIALQIVLVWHQGFTNYSGLPVNPPATPGRPRTDLDWASNPYNLLVGGPFNNPASFFASDQGRNLFKRRLRYIVARWGYSPAIFSWEVIDQFDRVATVTPDVFTDWLRASVSYLREIDPYAHMITAGLRDTTKQNLLDPVVLDFKQARFYQRRPIETPIDQVVGTLNTLAPMLAMTDRPVLMTEFSLNPWFEPTADDPNGAHIRETLWATALSGSAGGAMTWWWDTYLFPKDLSRMLAPLAAFTKGIPWNTADIQPVSVSLVAESSSAANYEPLHVTGYSQALSGPLPPDVTYRLTPEGVIPSISTAPSYLYGLKYNPGRSRPQKYVITPPVDTKLTLTVRRVSEIAGARLVIIIDGKTVTEVSLNPRAENVVISVPISAGEHQVVLDNLGDDFLQIDSLEIGAYISPIRTLALADRSAGLLLAWLHHRAYTWQNIARGGADPVPIQASLRASGMPPGMYRVELWDPVTGNVLGQEQITVPPGKDTAQTSLSVGLVPISRMLAVRAVRVAEPGNLPIPSPTFTPTPRVTATPALPTPIPSPGTPRAPA